MMSAFEDAFVGLRPEDLAFQCANINWRMKRTFEAIINAPVLLTVGSVAFKGTPICTVMSTNPQDMRRTGNFHVWWSLGSGEIVDLTLMVSVCVANKIPLEKAQPLAGPPEGFPAITWEPVMVGDEVTLAILEATP